MERDTINGMGYVEEISRPGDVFRVFRYCLSEEQVRALSVGEMPPLRDYSDNTERIDLTITRVLQ